MHNPTQPIGEAYDLIAANYDAQWSAHVGSPQCRLTNGFGLRRGERCADLGCGTGLDTLEMALQVQPGEVVGVDCSPGMLEATRRRAAAAGLALTTRCQAAERFIELFEPASFDVISLRFCLGYLDSSDALQRLPRLLRAGGRLGILTILAGSAPQAYDIYKQMAGELAFPIVALTALEPLEQIEAPLRAAKLAICEAWLHEFRLTFATGEQLTSWLRTSGIATTPLLSTLPVELANELWRAFGKRVEAQRGAADIPLDFQIAGVIARRA